MSNNNKKRSHDQAMHDDQDVDQSAPKRRVSGKENLRISIPVFPRFPPSVQTMVEVPMIQQFAPGSQANPLDVTGEGIPKIALPPKPQEFKLPPLPGPEPHPLQPHFHTTLERLVTSVEAVLPNSDAKKCAKIVVALRLLRAAYEQVNNLDLEPRFGVPGFNAAHKLSSAINEAVDSAVKTLAIVAEGNHGYGTTYSDITKHQINNNSSGNDKSQSSKVA